MECSQKKWEKTTKIETPDDLPPEFIEEIKELWQDLKTGRAKNQTAKRRMIETYNTIYNTKYSTTTNCGSCLEACFMGIKRLYKKSKPPGAQQIADAVAVHSDGQACSFF